MRHKPKNRSIVEMEAIEDLSRRIAMEFKPEKIILFGSHAAGRPGPDSDVDLLVIMRFRGKAAFKASEIRLKTRPAFPVDILVRTPGKIRTRLAMGDGFMSEILESGKVLYEADRG